ncbi:MAG: phage protein Gp37 [Desulfovibrionaceae bacterium]
MADRTITEIEDAVLAKLAGLTASHGVRQVGPYNGDLDLERFQAAVQQWPAVLAYYSGSSFEDHGQRRAEIMEFVIFTCERHASDQSQARRGGPTNPGSYALLKAVADLLEGSCVIAAGDVFPCERLAQQSEIQGQGLSVYSARYAIKTVYLVPME